MSEQLKTYTVVWEGTVREFYSVEAESEEEAREAWYNYEPEEAEE